MITIQDWIAAIPEEDKHIAFVGEHQSVTRQFLLTGSDWKTYEDWGFHLDMAFDLSTVTSRSQRTLEKTQVSNTENITETQVKTTGSTTKEKYTQSEVEVDCDDKTDIATLKKKVLDDGIRLTWTVLRQHTQLPGKLRATLRALGPDGQVKKSDLMVFEVEPAVVAEAAADIPQSEFEAMEEHMDAMLDEAQKSAQMVEFHAQAVETSLESTRQLHSEVNTALGRINSMYYQIDDYTERAEKAANTTLNEVNKVLECWPSIPWSFDLVRGNNWLDPHEVVHEKGQLANGLIGNDSTKALSLTGYIPVQEGQELSYQRTDPDTGQRIYGSIYALCLFDEYGNVNLEANQFEAESSGRLHKITVPAGVSYLRFTLHHLKSAVDAAIVPGHDLIPYEPYRAVHKLKSEGYDSQQIDATTQAVRYVPQTLTEEQKAQARANLGVHPVTVDATLDSMSTNPVENRAVLMALGEMNSHLQIQINELKQSVALVTSKVGLVDNALDEILTLQQNYIGGDGE